MLMSAHLAAASEEECLDLLHLKHFRSEIPPPSFFILVGRQRWEEMDISLMLFLPHFLQFVLSHSAYLRSCK